jgi:hypothetical protein
MRRAITAKALRAAGRGDLLAIAQRTSKRAAKKATAHRVPLEHEEQRAVIAWADAHKDTRLRLLLAIPNGARVAMKTAKKLKAEGLRAGVPDLFLPVPALTMTGAAHGLFVEMKRVKGGAVSQEQGEWHEALRGQGYRVYVAHGADAAIAAICAYLGVER